VDFLVKRDNLHERKFVEEPVPELEAGEALLEVDAFALTSNNVTYGVLGDALSYWSLFPAPDGWGRIPVWGFADVAASTHDGLPAGTRVFGYLPPSTHVVVSPGAADEQRFVDASPHRAELAAVYNTYVRVDADPAYDARHEDQQMLLRPLFGTGHLIVADLADNEFFGADAVLVSSASSKTALGTAFLLSRRGGLDVIGLTSPKRVGFVEGLGVYDRVAPYRKVGSLARERAVYVDISGDPEVRAAVHHHYGETLAHSMMVGATHWDRASMAPAELPGPQPAFFFAPDVLKRGRGAGGAESLRAAFEWAAGWLRVVHGRGPDSVERAYLELLDGDIDPSTGHVLSLRAS
jgi:hypothetical protein